jgi:Ca2+-binding EF-hand superfamily protein
MQRTVAGAVLAGLFVTLVALPVDAAGGKGAKRGKRAAGKQKPNPEQVFRRLDKDNDGKLSLTEFTGQRDGEHSEHVFKRIDKDSDGQVTATEFRDMLGQRKMSKK